MPPQEGEQLLRIALFSDSLRVTSDGVPFQTLKRSRRTLASTLRETRKKGVIPVYISLGWFLFSLALAIEDAFGRIGDNQTAHNLALGLLIAWLPVFLIATIVDRNPVGAERNRRKLNEFLEDVRAALLYGPSRTQFLARSARREHELSWTSAFKDDDFRLYDFFAHFAGQGRIRWHYGVAHPILAAMERSYVSASGRGWLGDTNAATSAIIWDEPQKRGLIWFDPRMAWQISSSLIVVGGTVFGAFILSCMFSSSQLLEGGRLATAYRLSRLHSDGRPGLQKWGLHGLLRCRTR